jgi:hypothetical protein
MQIQEAETPGRLCGQCCGIGGEKTPWELGAVHDDYIL